MAKHQGSWTTLAVAGLALVLSQAALAEAVVKKDIKKEPVAPVVAQHKATHVKTHGGLMVGEKSQHHWFKTGGLIQMDQVFVKTAASKGHSPYPNSANLKTARLNVEGGLGQSWDYYLGIDVAGLFSSTQSGFGDFLNEATVTYTHPNEGSISFGKTGASVFLYNTMSTKDVVSMRRPAVVNAFTPADGLGIFAQRSFHMLNVQAAVWAPAPSNGADQPYGAGGTYYMSDNLGASARLFFVPVNRGDQVWHFGATALTQYEHANHNTFNFSASTPITGRTGLWAPLAGNSVRSNMTTNTVRDWSVGGLEMAALWGPLSLQTEYLAAHVRMNKGVDSNDFNGFYATVAYTLTGEARAYDFEQGVLKAPKPSTHFGAWEVYAQYAALGLRDHDTGGLQNDTSVGLNWYINDNVRAQVEYSYADMRRMTGTPAARDLNLFGLRLQAAWG